MNGKDVFVEIEDLLEKYDGDFKIDVATQCMWSATLRLTLTNPENAPSRSITFFKVAGANPQEAALAVLKDAIEWMDDEKSA